MEKTKLQVQNNEHRVFAEYVYTLYLLTAMGRSRESNWYVCVCVGLELVVADWRYAYFKIINEQIDVELV